MANKREEAKKRQRMFQQSRRAELDYARQLRQVAKQIGVITKGMWNGKETESLQEALKRYAELLRPLAKSVGERMLRDVARRDYRMWSQMGEEISERLTEELADTPLGDLMRQRLNDQIHLITSIPLEASERVHKLSQEAVMAGKRYDEISDEIFRTQEVSKGRANLIARTEVARAASEMTMARAEQAGCTHYIWRTAHDSDVRSAHRNMEGKVIPFREPPLVEPGKPPYHAGEIYNCRCYMEPVLPDNVK